MADPQHSHKRLTFDPTINAGHVLTFIGLLLAGLAAWGLMDKRVTLLEQAAQYQRERDATQDGAVALKFQEVREGLKEVKDAVKDLALEQRPPQQQQQGQGQGQRR